MIRRYLLWIVLVWIGLLGGICFGEVGDWVTLHLKDGRVLSGEVLEETPDGIKINCHLAGITTEMRFAARDVVEIEREGALDEDGRRRGDDWRVKKTDEDLEEGKVKERGGYVVVPAEGAIGVELTTFFFEETCERAVRSGAGLIVYELTSPGGYLHILWDIRETLDEFEDDIQIAFYTNGDCFSAAALLCMSSQHFYVGEDATFGAAVIWQSGADGEPTAVDAKFASAEAAKWRRQAERRGRPSVVIDALIRQEAEVWADRSTTPWTLYPGRREGGGGEELHQVDSRTSVLTMTGGEAQSMGAVDGVVGRVLDIAGRVEIMREDYIAMDGKKAARVVVGIQSKNIGGLRKRMDQVSKNLIRMQKKAERGELSQSGARREVSSLRRIALRLMDMYEGLDYARDYLRGEFGVSREMIQGMIDELTALWTALR